MIVSEMHYVTHRPRDEREKIIRDATLFFFFQIDMEHGRLINSARGGNKAKSTITIKFS